MRIGNEFDIFILTLLFFEEHYPHKGDKLDVKSSCKSHFEMSKAAWKNQNMCLLHVLDYTVLHKDPNKKIKYKTYIKNNFQ